MEHGWDGGRVGKGNKLREGSGPAASLPASPPRKPAPRSNEFSHVYPCSIRVSSVAAFVPSVAAVRIRGRRFPLPIRGNMSWRFRGTPHYLSAQGDRLGLSRILTDRARFNPEIHRV